MLLAPPADIMRNVIVSAIGPKQTWTNAPHMSAFGGKADIAWDEDVERCAGVLMQVHKASTQNQNLHSKTSKISMSQSDKRKSCHSDH